MSRDGGRCFLLGLRTPPLPVPPPSPPTPKRGETRSYPLPSGNPKSRSSAPGASGCRSRGPPIDGAGASPPSQPPFHAGVSSWMLAEGGAGCPPCPVPQLCPRPSFQEAAGSRVGPCSPQRCSPGITSSLHPNACDGKDFHPLPFSSTTLNFSVTQSVKQLFFSLYNPNAGLKKPTTHFLPCLVKGV